jgi:hypothetical protein
VAEPSAHQKALAELLGNDLTLSKAS